jgi:hypothetical protein
MELEQIEQAHENGTLDANPEDIFAYVFKNYMPTFRTLMHGLGAKGKTRVVLAMMEYPLNEKTMKLMSQEERNAVILGLQVLEAKYAMILFAQMQSVHEQASAEASNKPEGDTNE